MCLILRYLYIVKNRDDYSDDYFIVIILFYFVVRYSDKNGILLVLYLISIWISNIYVCKVIRYDNLFYR